MVPGFGIMAARTLAIQEPKANFQAEANRCVSNLLVASSSLNSVKASYWLVPDGNSPAGNQRVRLPIHGPIRSPRTCRTTEIVPEQSTWAVANPIRRNFYLFSSDVACPLGTCRSSLDFLGTPWRETQMRWRCVVFHAKFYYVISFYFSFFSR